MARNENALQVSRPCKAVECSNNNSVLILRGRRRIVKVDKDVFVPIVLEIIGGIALAVTFVLCAIAFFLVFGG